MPILLPVESKSRRGRLFHAAVLVLLTLGAVTMLYPFALMVSGALRSQMDENELGLVPTYFTDTDGLYRKFLEYKYEQNIATFDAAHLRRDYAFRLVPAPETVSPVAAADLRRFLAETAPPAHWQGLAGIGGERNVPENLRQLRQRFKTRFGGDVGAFSQAVGSPVANWGEVTFFSPEWLSARYDFEHNALGEEYLKMLGEAPPAERRLVSLTGTFLALAVYPRYGSVAEMNAGLGLNLRDYHEFRLPRRVPAEAQAAFRAAWLEFVREDLNASFVLTEGVGPEAYRAFLQKLYGDIAELNKVWGTRYGSCGEIALPAGEFLPGGVRRDYNDFLRTLPPERLVLSGPEYAWADWLRGQYASVEEVSAAYRRDYADFSQVWLPLADLEMEYTRAHAGSLRWAFATRNFVNAFEAAAMQGHILRNTAIYCALAVLLAIIINPLAAYALSRFQLPGTYKVLLLMMAVMAFPPMVTTIPVFLMVQKLGLMNTFAGLLLPTVANGYLIFLLKGFFDSLPRELYEAARIEGASEARMFTTITLALSKPILAVVALSAFNAAYSTFLFALIIAPEQDMWLLPVWLYQYRETVSTGGVFASVLLASVPPILVFLFAQNVILRGIVVPTEK
ncbi:MAG: ABC transporter permease subunit [Verrucomicrobiota bacterium JB024]|nr:ABC transporter permease subunit [Verrucomicrobiota bacterium JB024]